MAEHEDEADSQPGGSVERGPHQLRADTPSLSVGHDRERGQEHGRRVLTVVRIQCRAHDLRHGEQDVAHHLSPDFRQQRDHRLRRGVREQIAHEVGLVVLPEGRPVDPHHVGQIGLDGRADAPRWIRGGGCPRWP